MSTASEVAMTVIEPGGRRWAQLLDVGWTVRDLLPLILSRLDLPEQLDYDLRHVRSDRVLKPGDTLQGIGIAAGEAVTREPGGARTNAEHFVVTDVVPDDGGMVLLTLRAA